MRTLTLLADNAPTLSGLDDPIFELLISYWHEQKLGATVPARRRIDPMAIDMALPWTLIIHRNSSHSARVRVAGQKLHEGFGRDPRGMNLDALFDQQSKPELDNYLDSLFRRPAMVQIPIRTTARILRPSQPATMLLLPLADAQGKITRAIGAVCGLGYRKWPTTMTIDQERSTRVKPVASTYKKGPDVARPALRLVIDNAAD